ncbi:phosphopantetheine-binding protein [Streptomyces sp. NPDC058953]|uniref:phosphopantetheine-binding protein n=1 Tax=unclassified Streptomyces TaxID=2593676 RepID=UPI0036B4EA3D
MDPSILALVVNVWRDVLKVDRIESTDDFFELGGHSLLASRVLARLGKETGGKLTLRTFDEAPTVELFAAALEAELKAGTGRGGD